MVSIDNPINRLSVSAQGALGIEHSRGYQSDSSDEC